MQIESYNYVKRYFAIFIYCIWQATKATNVTFEKQYLSCLLRRTDYFTIQILDHICMKMSKNPRKL